MNNFFSLRKGLLLLVISSLLFITCAKEYSYEGGPVSPGSSVGTATYTLVGAGGTCLGSVIAGNYFTGTALDVTNTITLQVDVSVIGTYSLATGTINGFQFTGSGTFTATGVQSITLTGAGTPGAPGDFTFSTPANSICSFIVTVKDAPPVQAVYTLAGAPNDCQPFVVNGDYHPGKVLNNFNTVDVTVDVTALGAYKISTDTQDGISFTLSGSFTKLGKQVISLVGSGTPDFARNLVFTPQASIGSSKCTFALTVTDASPLATYVIESGVGTSTCVFTMAGTYAANTPLTPAHTMTIRVTATVIGNYTIATNSVNGMMFARSGTFTVIGQQNVALEGSGTPLAAGTFTFTPRIVGPSPIGGTTCSLNLVVN